MSTPASDFAEVGADLFRLVAGLARATNGRFDGDAALALETAVVYARAGTNGFAALAASSGITADQKLRSSNLSSAFRGALGSMFTYFPAGSTVTQLKDLGAFDPRNPHQDRLGVLLGQGEAKHVTVSDGARDALNILQRDPIGLSTIGTPALLKQMESVASGVKVMLP